MQSFLCSADFWVAYSLFYPKIAERFRIALHNPGEKTAPQTVQVKLSFWHWVLLPGITLNSSPLGLASYIMEKFSTWTKQDYRQLPHGGLGKKMTLDEMLTNVMLYWISDCITSSMRFYAENLSFTEEDDAINKYEPFNLQMWMHLWWLAILLQFLS